MKILIDVNLPEGLIKEDILDYFPQPLTLSLESTQTASGWVELQVNSIKLEK